MADTVDSKRKASNLQSEAARFNAIVLKQLEKALARDPEVDLLSKFPSRYSARLAEKKTAIEDDDEKEDPLSKRTKMDGSENGFDEGDTRSRLHASDTATTLFPLSDSVKQLLSGDSCLSHSIVQLLARSEVLFRTSFAASVMVLKVDARTVVKIIPNSADLTEYTTMQYLQNHKPGIPAPKPLGLVELNGYYLIFMSYMPGMTLEKVWPQLDQHQKTSICDQLDAIFTELRSLPYSEGMPLGGVGGEGCKDPRRNLRRSPLPILSAKDFEAFLFSNPHYGSRIFINFLRRFAPPDSATCVFTHGDVRLENIIVDLDEEGRYVVTGVLDWEYSGFYPEYWESTKITNCLATNEKSDWYLCLPQSISPLRYPTRWLLDRVWGKHIE